MTNVILSFLTTPRADSKRFEILSLLASVLSWTDSEREKAGLQRTTNVASSLLGRGPGKGKAPELEKTDETEVRYVLFLLSTSIYLTFQSLNVSLSPRCGWNFFSKRLLRGPRHQTTCPVLRLGGPAPFLTHHFFHQAGHLKCLDACLPITGPAYHSAVPLITLPLAPRIHSMRVDLTTLPGHNILTLFAPYVPSHLHSPELSVYLHCILIIPALSYELRINCYDISISKLIYQI